MNGVGLFFQLDLDSDLGLFLDGYGYPAIDRCLSLEGDLDLGLIEGDLDLDLGRLREGDLDLDLDLDLDMAQDRPSSGSTPSHVMSFASSLSIAKGESKPDIFFGDVNPIWSNEDNRKDHSF